MNNHGLFRSLCLIASVVVFGAAHADVSEARWFAVNERNSASLAPLLSRVSKALDRSPTLKEAQANLRAARGDIEQSKGALWPRLEMNANSPGQPLDSSGGQTLSTRAGVTVSYNLHDFGRVRDQIGGRESLFRAQENKVLLARETTVFDTVNAYLQLLKNQRLVRIYNEHIEGLQGLVDKLQEIVRVFKGRRSELTQAQTRLGQSKDALVALNARLREQQLGLMRLTGSDVPETIPDVLPSIPLASVEELMSGAVERHPAIRTVAAEASAARSQAEEVLASLKPQTDLQITKQTGHDIYGQRSPAQLFLNTKWVAFDGFGMRANAQAYEERADAADERTRQATIEVEFNIRNAASDYQTQSSRANELADLVRDTDRVRKDYYDQWRELGRRSLLDVLTAENDHLNTRLSLVSSELDRVVALARIRHEAGTLADWLEAESPAIRAAEAAK